MEGVTANLTNVNLQDVLQSTIHIQQTTAAEKGIRLTNQLKNSISIIADADMLQLVVRNLINNAIKFTNPGGHIVVSSDIIENDCRIMIKDDGTGISFEQQKSIFSLKVNSSFGTKNEKGVGLGLILCKEFTELQGGKITFESKPGVGTIFYLSFKLYRHISQPTHLQNIF